MAASLIVTASSDGANFKRHSYVRRLRDIDFDLTGFSFIEAARRDDDFIEANRQERDIEAAVRIRGYGACRDSSRLVDNVNLCVGDSRAVGILDRASDSAARAALRQAANA